MVRLLKSWVAWATTFLCACSASVPALPAQRGELLGSAPAVVIRPGGYRPVNLSREEFHQGMRMLYAHGPLPGLPKRGPPRFLLTSADAAQMVKAEGYLQWCQRITGKRFDCWEELNASGGLDDEGATYVALHFALSEALEDAAAAVQSMTPTQVRAMLSVMFLGMIVELLSPEPVTKVLFVLTATNLISYVGVDLFNSVVRGFTAMLEELRSARDFDGVRAAGIHYGQRLGPTVARIVVMIATYGVARFAGLFKGSALELPGGSRAAALAEAQGLPLGGARSIALSADGSVTIELGTTTAMSAAAQGGSVPPVTTQFGAKIEKQLAKRGWTKESVEATLRKPARTVATQDTRYRADGTRMDDPATAYINEDGSYVVRNERTGDIVQVSDRTDPGWKSPW